MNNVLRHFLPCFAPRGFATLVFQRRRWEFCGLSLEKTSDASRDSQIPVAPQVTAVRVEGDKNGGALTVPTTGSASSPV